MSNHLVEILSLWAWWRLPGASGLAPLLCDNTWQVALPVTSNPKSVQNDQRSSPGFLCIWVREIVGRGQCSQIAAQPERRTARPSTSAAQVFIEIAACLSHCLGRQVAG